MDGNLELPVQEFIHGVLQKDPPEGRSPYSSVPEVDSPPAEVKLTKAVLGVGVGVR